MNTTNQSISFKFNQLKENQVMIVNDSVMGGKSSSQFEIKDKGIQFMGNVSLRNNGGFASLRMLWPFKAAIGYHKLQLKLTGDGKTYQFRIRTNRGFDGAAYAYEFKTVKDKSTIVEMDVEQFVPSFRGRVLRDMPLLSLEDVQQMGLLIADKQVGGFAIEIESLSLINQ